MQLKHIILAGTVGPIVGVVEVTASALTSWRCCAACGWMSKKFSTDTPEMALDAAPLLIAEQSIHLQLKHPDFIEQAIEDAGESAFAPMPQGMVC